jgi:hypothetical protein
MVVNDLIVFQDNGVHAAEYVVVNIALHGAMHGVEVVWVVDNLDADGDFPL